VDADGGQRLADLVQFERFDDRDDELHWGPSFHHVLGSLAVRRRLPIQI
jgi:hypothetical protein